MERCTTIFANGFLDFAILGVEGAYHMHNAKDDSVEIYGGHIAFNKAGPNRFVYLTLAGRKDWVSNLAPENRSIIYPSASASFIPTSAFPEIKSDNKVLKSFDILGKEVHKDEKGFLIQKDNSGVVSKKIILE